MNPARLIPPTDIDSARTILRSSDPDERRMRPYAERRTTDEWRVLRDFMLAKAKYRCQLCRRSGRDVQLNVHHNTYENYGQERLEDPIVLCHPCHAGYHSVDEAS